MYPSFPLANFSSHLKAIITVVLFLSASLITVDAYSLNASTSKSLDGSYTISWETSYASHYNQTYKLFQQFNSGSWAVVGIYAYRTTSFSFTGKANGTWRYKIETTTCVTYPVQRCYAGVMSDEVVVVVDKITPPATPSSISVPSSDADGTFTVSWGVASGSVSSYRLQRQTNSGSWPQVYSGTSRSKSQSGLADATYRYRVQACNLAGCSGWRYSGYVVVKRIPGVPANISVPETSSTGSITVSWGSASGAVESYKLQRQIDEGIWTQVYSGTSRSQSYSLGNGFYRYRVQACNSSGCSNWRTSNQLFVGKPQTITLSSSVATSVDGTFTLSWTAGSILPDDNPYESYIIYQKLNSGSWTTLGTLNLSFSFAGKAEGTWRYRVERESCITYPVSYCVTSSSNELAVVVDYPPTPSMPSSLSVPARDADGTFSVGWGASTGVVDTYNLQRQINSGSWFQIYSGSSLSITQSTLADATYHYQVRACNLGGCSDWRTSDELIVKRLPGTPPNISVPQTADPGTTINISWGESSGSVTSYKLERQYDGDWTEVYSGTATSTPNLVEGGVYHYRVKACNSGGCSSWRASHEVVVGKLENITLTSSVDMSTDGTFTLSWTEGAVLPGNGNDGPYILYQKLNSGDWQPSTMLLRQVTITDRTEGTWHYKVDLTSCMTFPASYCVESTSNEVSVKVVGGAPPVGASPVYSELPALRPLVASENIGAIAGDFRVDESGAATYSIPIAVPEGTAGVAPQISLNYSSQGGNGVVGLGWSLNATSTITRCRQTLARDGVAKPITWSDEDRFCLGGQRLILHSGNHYGAVGATYKTEIDSFVTVKSYYGTSGHPDYFKVTAKDGSTATYGGTANAKQKEGSHVLSWAQNKFQDSVGNKIEYLYEGGSDGSGLRLVEIKYAYGNGVLPHAKVSFKYQTREDITTGYVAGSAFSTTKLLASIDINNNANGSLQPVKHYNLGYISAVLGSTESSRLSWIQECGYNVSNSQVCLPATSFEWAATDLEMSESGSDSITLSHRDDRNVFNYRRADINGDGYTDIVWLQWNANESGEVEYRLQYMLSDGNAFNEGMFTNNSSSISYVEGVFEKVRFEIIDYNADGRQDLIVYNSRVGFWRVHLAEPHSEGGWRLSALPSVTTPLDSPGIQFADLDSDGLVDAAVTNQRWYLKRNSNAISSPTPYSFEPASNVTFPSTSGPNSANIPSYCTVESKQRTNLPGDFDGNGTVDLLSWKALIVTTAAGGGCESRYVIHALTSHDDAYKLYATFYSASSTNPQPSPISQEGELPLVADFNSDGLSDLVSESHLWINNGQGFNLPKEWAGYTSAPQVRDYNGDGSPDVLWHEYAENKIYVSLWNGTTLADPIPVVATDGDGQTAHIFADMNADGALDHVTFKSDTLESTLAVGPQPGEAWNSIIGITNGYGSTIAIDYGSLSHSGHYERIDASTSSQESTTKTLYSNCPSMNPQAPCTWDTTTQTYTLLDEAAFYSRLNGDWDQQLPQGSQYLSKTTPTLEVSGPIYVVTAIESSAPKAGVYPGQVDYGATSRISYYYAEAKMQAGGRGFLGFHKLKTIDEQTQVATTTTYRQDFPFIGMPLGTAVRSKSGHLISHAVNNWRFKTHGSGDNLYYQSYLAGTQETAYSVENNGASPGNPLSIVTTEQSYDDYGNLLTSSITTEGAGKTFTQSTVNDYGSSEWSQKMGRLQQTTVTKTNPQGSISRTSSFTYYQSGSKKGLLKAEVVEPDKNAYRLTTTYEHDAFGNIISMTTSGQGVDSRVETYAYGPLGRYLVSSQNSYGHTTSKVLARNAMGAATRIENINGVVTTKEYDAFGRLIQTYVETGAFSNTVLKSSGSLCPAGVQFVTVSRQAGGAETRNCIDMLGRSVRKLTRGFGGAWIYQDTEYDAVGRVKYKSEPYFAGDTAYWTQFNYDILGRVTSIILPDGSTTSTLYEGFSQTLINAKGQTKTEVKNAIGQLVRVIDNRDNLSASEHERGEVSYEYDAYGNLRFMHSYRREDGAVLTTEIRYDALGRKVYMNDPDKGEWHYRYNVFGELVWQKDAKGQITKISYDALGRQETRTDITATGQTEGYTRWYYDQEIGDPQTEGTSALGALTAVVMSASEGGASISTANYRKLYTYDSYGRLESTTVGFPGHSETFTTHRYYDEVSRNHITTDALTGKVGPEGANTHGLQKHYNAYGYLTSITDLASNDEIYRVEALNARGQVVQALRGNGVTSTYGYDAATGRKTSQYAAIFSRLAIQDIEYSWDVLGNLRSRHNRSVNAITDAQKNLRESFCYDNLNRLVKSTLGTLNSSCGGGNTIAYDSLGNITYKAGVGTYTYGQNGAGPHAVSHTSDGINYSYDANGNMISDTAVTGANGEALGGRTLTYATFDKPIYITKGNTSIAFKYGPGRARYQRVESNGDTGITTTTYYLGGVERITRSDKPHEVQWKRYLNGVAIYTITTDTGTTNSDGETVYTANHVQKRYIYKDHLGSTDVITNSVGHVVQSQSFNAWGARRKATDWTAADLEALIQYQDTHNLLALNDITTRGYTGHEMLDSVGLIHMNGRIYDARLGRFIQADPFIQSPSTTGSLNRYSYIMNNPLNGVDPSGYLSLDFSWVDDLIEATKIVAIVAVGYYTGIAAYGAMGGTTAAAGSAAAINAGVVAGAAGGAVAGGFGAMFNGGNLLKGIARGALTGAIFGGIGGYFNGTGLEGGWQHIASQGVAGGVIAELQGGTFGHGFISAGITKLLNINSIMSTNAGALADMTRIIAAGMVGGTISRLTGGKFANGAVTAAAAQAFNGNGAIKERQEYLEGRLKKFKSLIEETEYSSSYARPNAEKLTITYDSDYNGVAVIDAKTGAITVGPKFFTGIGAAPAEATTQQAKFIESLSTSQQEMLVFRHELAHMHPDNRSMARNWLGPEPSRASAPWEQDATVRSVNWAREVYGN